MKKRTAVIGALVLLMPLGHPLFIATGTALTSASLMLSIPEKAEAKTASEIANISKEITVLIEGVQGGSGVLIKRIGNRYTVLTAWHCVSDIRKGDELEIQTSDGEWHQMDRGSIKQLGKVD